MVLKVVIARLGITAEPGQVITSFEIGQVVIALRKRGAYKMSNVLLLGSEKDMEGREETLSFLLYFLLDMRVKVSSSASGTLTATSILKENIGTRSES